MVLGFAVNIASFLVIQRTSSVVLEQLGSVDSSSRDVSLFCSRRSSSGSAEAEMVAIAIKIGPVFAVR